MQNVSELKLSLKELARLHGMSATSLADVLREPSPMAIASSKTIFNFADALEIEIARQLHCNSGVSLGEALRLSVYASAVQYFLVQEDANANPTQDFWFAVLGARNSMSNEHLGSLPASGLSPKEYWSEAHFTGSFGAVAGAISEAIGRDQVLYRESNPARILMANVSTAARRLRMRLAALGIELH